MKLLLVTYGLNTVGGVQHWQHLFSHKISELGHDVVILEMYDYAESHKDKKFDRNWNPSLRIIRNNGPIVQRGVNKRTLLAATIVILDIFSKIRLHRFIKSEKFDSILFTDPNFTFYFFRKTLASNNCYVQFHSSFERFKSTSRIRYLLTKQRHRLFRKFLFLSKGDCQNAISEGFDPGIVDYMYNFIDESKFRYEGCTMNKRQNRILFAGNLDNVDKQVDHLLAAFGMIEKEVLKDWKVWIIGDGASKGRLIQFSKDLGIEERVEFLGQMKDPSQYFFKSSLYIITSSFEGGPLTLLECLFANLPVISYKCSAFIQEVIIDKVTGALIERNNVRELSSAIRYYISNPHLIHFMSENIDQIKHKFASLEILGQWEKKLCNK